MTTWYIGGGATLAGWRSATTAPWPSSGRLATPGGGAGGGGGSTGMDSFYRVDSQQSQAWHIEPMARTTSPEMRHVRRSIRDHDGVSSGSTDAAFRSSKGKTGHPAAY